MNGNENVISSCSQITKVKYILVWYNKKIVRRDFFLCIRQCIYRNHVWSGQFSWFTDSLNFFFLVSVWLFNTGYPSYTFKVFLITLRKGIPRRILRYSVINVKFPQKDKKKKKSLWRKYILDLLCRVTFSSSFIFIFVLKITVGYIHQIKK